MDQNTVIVSLVGSITVVVGIVALLIKSFLLDKPKANGNGNGKSKQLDDIEERLEQAVTGFKENHLQELMMLKQLVDELREWKKTAMDSHKEIKALIGTCADILKKL